MKLNSSSSFFSLQEIEIFQTSQAKNKQNSYRFHFIYAHGALSHSRGQKRFLTYLVDKYPDSVVSFFDFSGHGRSGGRRAYVDCIESYEDELEQFVKIKKNKFQSEKTILIGYSMGGLVSLRTIAKNKNKELSLFDGLILVNPCLKLGDNLLASSFTKIDRITSHALGKIRLPVRAGASTLTNDEEIIKEINSDDLRSNHISLSLFRELYIKGREVRCKSIEFDCPILFLLSGADSTVNANTNRVYAQGLKKDLCTIEWYEYAKHDLLNEVNRNDVYTDMATWLNDNC